MGEKADMYLDDIPSSYFGPKTHLATNRQAEIILSNPNKAIRYANKKTALEELPVAEVALERACKRLSSILKHDVHYTTIDLERVKEAITPVVESVIRNPDAFMWLSKLQEHDPYTYEHSIQNSALGVVFGRHIGLTKKDLNILAIGLLLMDIGFIRIPAALLAKSEPYTEDEQLVLRKHVAFSVEMMRKVEGISEHVINLALTHHERYDGSGYPNGLKGKQIPVFGRMAAIIDCYNSLITTLPYRKAIPEHRALQSIYNMRDVQLHGVLVEQFIQCMGVYPTGSLVELSSGEVAAVLSQNTNQKMKPKIVTLLDAEKRPLKKGRVVDLATQKDKTVYISKSVEKNTYNIDVSKVRF
jgi:HD-GYP domain-containing protein (c-di-GMP phosphodiesterase class II)